MSIKVVINKGSQYMYNAILRRVSVNILVVRSNEVLNTFIVCLHSSVWHPASKL